jgi:hypothetical protein
MDVMFAEVPRIGVMLRDGRHTGAKPGRFLRELAWTGDRR